MVLALAGFQRCAAEREARLRSLGAVRAWFAEERHGPDAGAHALATSRANASQP